VARLLLRMVQGAARYRVVWRPLPLMSHTLRSTTLSGHMRSAVATARGAEQGEGHTAALPAVAVFGGFSLADIPAPCVSVVATAEDTPDGIAAAQTTVDRIAADIWAHRDDYVYTSEPLTDSLARAAAMADGATKPVLLLDHGDNCMSGGTCDTVDVLQAALAAGLSGIAVGPLCDPAAVAAMVEAGEGSTVTLPLGNKVPLTQLGLQKTPMTATGTVRRITDGSYVVTGPTYTGMRCEMGRTAVLDIGAATIVVTERPHEPWDRGVFESVGIDPTQPRFLMLKSRMYCRPVFEPLSAGLVECDSPGVTTSDYGVYPFTALQRPVYPFDIACTFDREALR